jgi:hypothetical protein
MSVAIVWFVASRAQVCDQTDEFAASMQTWLKNCATYLDSALLKRFHGAVPYLTGVLDSAHVHVSSMLTAKDHHSANFTPQPKLAIMAHVALMSSKASTGMSHATFQIAFVTTWNMT